MVVKNHLNQKEMMQFVVHQVAEIIIIKNKIEVNYLQKKIIKNKNQSSKLKLSLY